MDFNSPNQSPRLLRFRYAPALESDHERETLGLQEFDGKHGISKQKEGIGFGIENFGVPGTNSYGFFGSLGNPNLSRQSSSPADFGSQHGLNGESGELGQSSKRHVSLSSTFGLSSGNENIGHEDTRIFSGLYVPYASWNAAHLGGNANAMKRNQQNSIGRLFSSSQSGEFGDGENAQSEAVSMEKLLLYQESIPCKVRAKRGCATHPRSIAERVRRTRISERMRKLQELVPMLDKQTNTADMLDFAVEYIKDLQQQLEMLSKNRANCKCMVKQKPVQLEYRLN